jgi:hypothetical protein
MRRVNGRGARRTMAIDAGLGPPRDARGVLRLFGAPAYRAASVAPAGARWDDDLAEFVLPYELVRTAADAARWDRAVLERSIG